MATIVTKNSSTASAVPTTSDLVQGELAVNVTDKRIFTENASTQIVELGTNPSSITTATATVTGTLTANGTFASSNAVLTGGTVNGIVIGGSTPQAITGTTVTASTGFVGGLTGNVTGNLTGNVTGNVAGNLTGNVTGNVTASSGTTTLNDLVVNGTADFTNTKLTNITTPTVGSDAANKSYVDDTVAAVIDSAPAALDTLNELAAALGDDANFAGTVTTALATKLPLAGGTMTGAIAMGTAKITGLGDPTSAQDAATKTYVDTADALKLNLTGGTMSGAIAMGTNKITGVGNPTLAQDAATKAYTDSILGSATSAATSAAAAATSASNATTSASNAASSATASANSAIASAASATAAAASYDAFDDRYLGDKASDPTLDNDGNALLTGALYFNTTSDAMRVYNGTAWQDTAINPNSPTFNGTVTSDGYTLEEIALSKADTATDVFVYDTRKDSDGGAWRKRTQNTSWYNETLNTATRGSRKEFPAVAVIVAESTQVTIYDGDDPSLPMWMVFNGVGARSNQTAYYLSVATLTGLSALNGKISVSHYGTVIINIIADSGIYVGSSIDTNRGTFTKSIVDRNSTQGYTSPVLTAVHYNHNDVAMTVLPNAPIDAATGLPVPTIAVATDGGVSVITDSGAVYDVTETIGPDSTHAINFTEDNKIIFMWSDTAGIDNYPHIGVMPIPSQDESAGFYYSLNFISEDYSYTSSFATTKNGPAIVPEGNNLSDFTALSPNRSSGYKSGLSHIYPNAGDARKALVAYTTSTYNTGWMNGDIKLATLSDTDDTDVTGSQLVTNGTFDTDTTGWTGQNNATLSVVSGALRVTNDGSTTYPLAVQSFATEVGKTYTVSARGLTSPAYNWYIEIIGGGSTAQTNDEYKSHTFTAISTTSTLRLVHRGAANGNYKDFDDVSIRIAEVDRSVKRKGLQVFGTITKNPVATGADLVAYSGFSASNYLEQPYNSDLDFGTGDFCVMGWVKPNLYGATDWLFSRGSTAFAMFISSGAIGVNLGGANRATADAPPLNTWTYFVNLREGGSNRLYLNGELKGTGSATGVDVSGSSPSLMIGNLSSDLSRGFDGSLALMRISATAPTAAQIAKIYNDEKFLFQDNSQATLYGSSDAVTALAYDDDTELLHVGTSAGRSVFQGLRRVDNTTDAVGAAISASNGLIAED
jgi:trimeric autotransporter adhesin